MNSTMKMVLDANNGNQPAIRVQAELSDDLRDQIFQIFVDHFRGSQSQWCKVEFERLHHSADTSQKQAIIVIPIKMNDMQQNFKEMADVLQVYDDDWFKNFIVLNNEQYMPAVAQTNGDDRIKIVRFASNKMSVEFKSESNRYDDCSVAQIEAIRGILKGITASPESQKGKTYRELLRLYNDMGGIIKGNHTPYSVVNSPLINGKKTVADWLDSISSLKTEYGAGVSGPIWHNLAVADPGIFIKYVHAGTGSACEERITADDMSDKMNDLSKSRAKFNIDFSQSVFLEIHGKTYRIEFEEKITECAPMPD